MCAVPSMAVFFFFLHFLNFVLSWYVAQVLSECFEIVPVAPIIIGITFPFIFHMR